MDPRLLDFYNRELQHLRDMGGEFARDFPKVAGRLALTDLDCADPYVERLLEGFAFLTARVQLQIHAEFPRFTQQLLQMVYPQYLTPTPSMVVARFQPDLTAGELTKGFKIPRGSALRSQLGKYEQTACEYRTAHDVNLWPIELVQAEYFTRDLTNIELPNLPGVRAALRLRLRVAQGKKFAQLPLDRLPVFLSSGNEVAHLLYELLLSSALAVVVRPAARPFSWQEVLPKTAIAPLGFDEEEALLPVSRRSFAGYRLLHEYFAFPERYLFVELRGLEPALAQAQQAEVDVMVLLGRNERRLESAIDADDFSLFCAPAINLFPKRADRVPLARNQYEYHIVVDRTRPMDFELHDVSEVIGYGDSNDLSQEFLPFYAVRDNHGDLLDGAYYSLRRVPRKLSERQRSQGPRSTYIGSETYISLVDAREAPFRNELRQLALQTFCTNRDLPLQMPVGVGSTDFTLESSAPVKAITCAAGPTRPKPSLCHAEGELSWRLISHLSLNYLSLCNTDEEEGAAGLRELLRLYSDLSEPHVRKQIDGVRSITTTPVVRRIPNQRRAAFGRGLQTNVLFDESAFEGAGVFLLGAVLERFFAKYVSLNSFTETVIRTASRGEIMRWPARSGLRHSL